MGKQNPLTYDFSNVQVPYRSSGVDESNLQQVAQNDYFLQNFKTPSDIEEYKNFIINESFNKLGIDSPYTVTGGYKAQFDKEAEPISQLDTDTPEVKAFKEIRNRLVRFGGKLPEAEFMHKAFSHSMTAGWIKLLTGNDDVMDLYGGFSVTDDGYKFKGQKLKLDDQELKLVSDFINRSSGQVTPDTFWDKVGQTAVGLSFDLPLLTLTGGIAGGVMKAGTVTQALSKSTDIASRLLGQVVQQSINFNILGIPQTVDALKEKGIDGALNSIWHNVQMGSLAAGTGTLGFAIGKGIGKTVMQKSPALTEELSSLAGSFGFGYLSTKMTGGTSEDAIATGLAFAATHFTNPSAYNRAIKEISNRNVKVVTESYDKLSGLDTPNPDYFIENKDGKLEKIDAEAFGTKGIIRKLNVEPLEINDANKNKFVYYNEMPNYYNMSYGQALAEIRAKKEGGKLYKRWLTETDSEGERLLTPEYVKTNNLRLRQLAEMTVRSVAKEKLSKTFSKWELPKDDKLSDELVKLSNSYKIPYTDLKKYVVTSVPEYFANPEDFIERLQENPIIAKEMLNLVKVTTEAFIKQAKSNYAQELLSKSGLPASKQLGMGEPPKPVDLKTEAERIQRIAERRNLKASVSGAEAPVNELKPDKYVFYDFNGELVPMVKEKGKLKIAGTNVEIPFEVVKDKVKTKAEIKKEIKEQKKAVSSESKGEKEFIQQAITDAGGAQKLSPDAMLSVIKKAREEWQTKNPPKEGVKDGQKETKVLKETQPSETVAEVKPEVKGELPEKGKINIGYKFADGSLISYKGTHGDETFNRLLKEKGISEDEFGQMFVDKKVQGGYIDSKGNFYTDAKKALDAEKIDDSVILKTTGADRNMLDRIANDIDLSLSKERSEIKPETTPISTVDKTTEPNTNIAPSETKATNEPKKDFEFEKSNLLDVVDNIIKDDAFITSPAGKAKITKSISDIQDRARSLNVPEKDIRDFTIISLKETGLSAGKVANMMKIVGNMTVTPDVVNNAMKRKGAVYGKMAKEFTTPTRPEAQPLSLFEEELAGQIDKANIGKPTGERNVINKDAEDLSSKDYQKVSLEDAVGAGGESLGERPREITRVHPETRMKRAEGVVKKILEKYDLEDRKQYEKALRDVSENAYLEEGGDTEVGIAMLQNAKLGRELRDPELVKPTLMFETRTPTKPMSAEELNAGIKDMESRGFIFEEGIIDQTNVPLSKEGKPQVRAGVTFKDSDGNIRTVIDKRFGVPDTIEHESFHQYMLKALGNDRKLVDRVLKDYGWDGKENQTLVDAHEAIIDQLAGRKQLSKPVQFIKETFEKFANWLHGKGFYSEAQLFRKLANGEINVGKPPRVPDLTFYERVAGDKDAIRYTLKSFDSILNNETLTINDSFWNRLKNKGVKDAEINYLKTFLEDGRQLKGEEFKSAVLEKMFPIQIKEVWETTTPRSGDAERPLRTLLKASQRFSGMTTSGGHNQSDIAQIKQKIADLDKSIAVYKEWKKNKDLQPELGERIETLLNERAGLFSELNSTKAEKYRILSFDIPNQVVKQVHDYWGNRKESVGWARVEDEVVNGNRTGYLNVNEIQGQLQYTNMPKVFEDLKPGDVYKFEGVKYRVVQPLPAYGGFENYRNQYGYVEVQKFEEGKWGSTENITKESYELDKISVGSEPKFLESMQPIMTDLQIKSLIQYAADNGYKGVRFPTMKSITDIEGFEHLTERAESLQREITSWEKIKNNNAIIEDATKVDERLESLYDEYKLGKIPEKEYQVTKNKINEDFIKRWGLDSEEDMGHAIVNAETVARQVKRAENYNSDVSSVIENELISSRQELEDITTGNTAQKTNAVKKFYEETVGMAGKRLRKENWQKVNDAYGNEWFETKVGAKDTDPIKFYQTIEKPADSKTDMLEFANNERLTELAEWENRMQGQRNAFSKNQKLTRMVLDNKLSVKVRRLGNKLLQSAIQTNNYVNQTDKHGNIIRVDEKGLYDIAKEFLVDKVPLARNTILKNQEGWNEGHHFRMLDGNSIKDYTNRNDLATKINRYGEDIYYGRKDAPELREGETLQQAHERIGKEIGLTDDQIKADWATQEAHRQANKLGYNATVDMFNNLKDVDNSKYVVSDGLSRKQLADVLGIDKKIKDDEAYQMARDIINADPQKRMQIATMLADKSQFAERFNPFYHNNTRPTNPKYWVITGNKPTQVDAEGNILKSDKFFTYAENEKQANQLAREWADKGFLIEENYNIGKEISDKRFNRLSANQLINLANAGHIPINNETIKALLEATKSGRFEQHGLTKKYVPGMHGTGKEYEQQVVNFVDEAVSASVRRYALDKMRDYIIRTDTELNAKLKSGFNMTEQDKERQRLTSEWMHQFYNQVSQSDNSIVDGLREVATTAYIGFKPSFPFMQMFQPLQMALPEAVKEAKGEGLAKFTKSFGTAWDLAYEIRARQKGESTGKVDEELYALYDKLDKMKKMGATGIRELTGEAGDIRLHYGSDSYRAWSTFMKVGNMGGAIAEKYTRLQSLAMWYDIGKSKGLYGKELERFILTKHDEIMSLWGASGRPVLGQSKELGVTQQKAIKAFTKSFFTFKTYTMSNLGQYDRLMRNRQWGALGTKMAVGVGLHGITKMPLMATFYALYNLLSDDDLEYEQIKALDEVNAGLLGRGVSSVLPINLQNMFDERTAFISDAYAETRSKSAEGKLLEAMLGAPYGVPKDVLEGSKAIYDIVKNNIDDDATMTEDERLRAKKNWSKVLPLAARNIFNGMNMKEDGIQVRGRELVKAEDISWGDVVYKWLGFNPNKVANAYELQFSGFPAKWTRVNGKIAELKKIRKEISTEKGYTPEERSAELKNVARLLKETMAEQSQLRKTADYKSAYKQGLISP